MKKLLLIIIMAFFAFTLNAQSGQIKLTIKNINTLDGTIKIAVFNKEAGFPNPERAIYHKEISITATEMTITFDTIPVGKYAITILHDKNNNGILDKDWLERPTEPIGFSQNKKGKFRPPSFDETAFSVEEQKCTSLYIYF